MQYSFVQENDGMVLPSRIRHRRQRSAFPISCLIALEKIKVGVVMQGAEGGKSGFIIKQSGHFFVNSDLLGRSHFSFIAQNMLSGNKY